MRDYSLEKEKKMRNTIGKRAVMNPKKLVRNLSTREARQKALSPWQRMETHQKANLGLGVAMLVLGLGGIAYRRLTGKELPKFMTTYRLETLLIILGATAVLTSSPRFNKPITSSLSVLARTMV